MFIQIQGVRTLHQSWKALSEEDLKQANSLIELERSIGYNGFVHNFKNYLIRRTDDYYDTAISSYQQAKINLNLLYKNAQNSQEQENINIILSVLDEYYFRLKSAHDQWRNLSTNDLDELVKINDKPAELALSQLRTMIIKGFENRYQLALNKTDLLERNTLVSAFFIIPVLLFLILMLYVFIKRFSKIVNENQAILESSPDGIIYADEEGYIIQTNKAACTIFGYSKKEFLKLTIEDLLDEKHRNKHKINRQNFTGKEQSRLMSQRANKILGKTKEGKYVDLSIAISSVIVDGESRSIAIARDITSINHLEKEANLDHLTNIFNRRSIDKFLKEELQRAERYQRPISLMLIDIDNFKQLNDSAGHLIGDEAIKQVADYLKGKIRPSDKLGRWGGDEFLLICPELNEQDSIAFAERIRAAFLQYPLADQYQLTLSIGITTYDISMKLSITQLISHADTALYRSKNNGRNKVSHFNLCQ